MELAKLQNGSDIRGVASEGIAGQPVNLTDEAVFHLAAGFICWLQKRLGKEQVRVGVGRDSRISGPRILENVRKAAEYCGAALYDTGLASTPAMFMSTITEGFGYDGAIMITASHLPFNRNGLKFFVQEGGLESSAIKEVIAIAQKEEYQKAEGGCYEQVDFMTVYAKILADKIRQGTGKEKPLGGMKIVVDAGNGAGGFFAREVLEPLGCDCSGSRFLEPDGHFPNHVPNPEDRAAMASIQEAVLEHKAHLGLIFDTDVDRMSAVLPDGTEVNRDAIIALAAAILAPDHPGGTVVTDSVTSDRLTAFLEGELGLRHRRFKRGYKNVINEMLRLEGEGVDCPLAMETSGHGALMENYALDDGAYLAVKIIIQAARLREKGQTLGDLLRELREPLEAAEHRLPIGAEDFGAYGARVLEALAPYAAAREGWQVAPDNQEGLRVSVPSLSGWFLLRMSLHDPLMPLNIESNRPGGAAAILDQLLPFLRQWEGLALPVVEK